MIANVRKEKLITDNECKELSLKAKPILFNTEMVRAILDGRKTVTRRVMKNPPPDVPTAKFRTLRDGKAIFEWDCSTNLCERKTPYYPDDILYVRETWYGNDCRYYYRADGEEIDAPTLDGNTIPFGKADGLKWRPSIHMPKEAARIFLRVTNVKVERLQDISDIDLIREGEIPIIHVDESLDREATRMSFLGTWNSAIKKSDLDKYGWAANPYVWVIEFEMIVSMLQIR